VQKRGADSIDVAVTADIPDALCHFDRVVDIRRFLPIFAALVSVLFSSKLEHFQEQADLFPISRG
jgi:hypothetical protein